MKNIIYLILISTLALFTSCSMKDTLVGSWKIEDASITVRNGQNITPDHSELGGITFHKDGSFVSEGSISFTDSYLEKLDDSSYQGQWDCNDKYSQMKIDECLWKVEIIDDSRIELRATVQRLSEGTTEYYCLLRKE